MGATNSTLHYQLSQFISTDKPAWLQDYNGDMQKIDTGINGALTAAESAQNSADSASSGVSTLGDAVSALTTTVSGHTSDITDISGDVNTIESLIGNGTPTAGDHTLIGAINTNTNDISDLSEEPDLLGSSTNTSFETVTLPAGKRFSDYRLVIVAELINNTIVSSCVPENVFRTTANGIIAMFLDSNNIQTRATAKYVSDTSAELRTGTAGTCLIYGLK